MSRRYEEEDERPLDIVARHTEAGALLEQIESLFVHRNEDGSLWGPWPWVARARGALTHGRGKTQVEAMRDALQYVKRDRGLHRFLDSKVEPKAARKRIEVDE